jgi:hypothetical protein
MANERRPKPGQQISPEQMAELQEMDRQWRLEFMPPQVDVNGMERLCVHCHSTLNPIHNHNYDGSTGGFCNKLCAADYETKCIKDGMSMEDAGVEVDKYEDWKPKRHSPVV